MGFPTDGLDGPEATTGALLAPWCLVGVWPWSALTSHLEGPEPEGGVNGGFNEVTAAIQSKESKNKHREQKKALRAQRKKTSTESTEAPSLPPPSRVRLRWREV